MMKNFTKLLMSATFIMLAISVLHAQNNPKATILCTYLTYPYDVTPTGDKVALQGFGEYTSFYWEENQEVVPIVGMVNGVSADGKLCGFYQDPNFVIYDMFVEVAGLWNSETQAWEFLGMNPDVPEFVDMFYNSAWAMTSDGRYVVGTQWTMDYYFKAFRWSPDEGYTIIGNNYSRASAVSSDASLIGGFTQGTTSRTPVVWLNDEQLTLNPDIEGETFCVSDNGIFAAGTWNSDRCFIWTEESGAVPFSNSLNSGFMGINCINDKGVIFGYTADSEISFTQGRTAFVRLNNGTMQTANDYFRSRGLEDADQWFFYMITDVTPDDNIFVGCGVSPQGIEVSFKLDFNEDNILNENNLSQLMIYPNPAEDYCIIPVDESTAKVEIINATGEVVFSSDVTDNSQNIKVITTDFAKGVYFVRTKSSNGIKTGKIVVL